MKRYAAVLAALCALVLALGAGSAFAGLIPSPPQQGGSQDVSNKTSQENKSVAIAAPILSGNNVALINGGDQTASADAKQTEGNANKTEQSAGAEQHGAPAPTSAPEKHSSDKQGPPPVSQQSGGSTDNGTHQENRSAAIAVPILSGNNVAVYNGGDQTASADAKQTEGNVNSTEQSGGQGGNPGGPQGPQGSQGSPAVTLTPTGPQGPPQGGPQGQGGSGVDNHTSQENKSAAIAVPILSGNNVALINGGDQTASADAKQTEGNINSTKQSGGQGGKPHGQQGPQGPQGPPAANLTGPQGPPQGGPNGQQGQGGSGVDNDTHQRNKSLALAVPILSGNNVAGYNGGDQNASADAKQTEGNANWTKQSATAGAKPHGGNQPSPMKHSEKSKGQQGPPQGGPNGQGGPGVDNDTHQRNTSAAIAVPILSGNNVALYNGGNQNASADATQTEGNANWTSQKSVQPAGKQHAQDPKSHKKSKGQKGGKGKKERCDDNGQPSSPRPQPRGDKGGKSGNVTNITHQSNKSLALAVPILSGNNVALINCGNQNASADATQTEGNLNWTSQKTGSPSKHENRF